MHTRLTKRDVPAAMAERRATKMRYRALAVGVFSLAILVSFLPHHTDDDDAPPRRTPLSCRDRRQQPDLPPPLFVVSAGASRSGSTVLYNALRILLRIRDPNLIAGWYVDLRHSLVRYTANTAAFGNASAASALRSSGASVLVKVHAVSDWARFAWGPERASTGDARMHPVVDAVFTTHRDVRDVLRSRRRMAWGAHVRRDAFVDPTFCVRPEAARPRWLSEDDYSRAHVWVDMARAQLACRQRLLDAAGDKLKDDVRMEDFNGEERALLRRLAANIPGFQYTEPQIEDAARELRLLGAPRCGGALDVHPVSHLHRSHVGMGKSERDGSEIAGIAAVERDATVRAWLRKHGYRVLGRSA